MAQTIGFPGRVGDSAGLPANTPRSSNTAPNEQVSKDLFLKLMVAQLKNQNPLNPVDGVDFLMQLSQISGVEQMVEMRKQLEGIHQVLSTAEPTAGNSSSSKS